MQHAVASASAQQGMQAAGAWSLYHGCWFQHAQVKKHAELATRWMDIYPRIQPTNMHADPGAE
jgi:hypothetical protein